MMLFNLCSVWFPLNIWLLVMLLNLWEFGGGGRERKLPDMMLSILQVSENVCYVVAVHLHFL